MIIKLTFKTKTQSYIIPFDNSKTVGELKAELKKRLKEDFILHFEGCQLFDEDALQDMGICQGAIITTYAEQLSTPTTTASTTTTTTTTTASGMNFCFIW
jgi:Ubiquitin family